MGDVNSVYDHTSKISVIYDSEGMNGSIDHHRARVTFQIEQLLSLARDDPIDLLCAMTWDTSYDTGEARYAVGQHGRAIGMDWIDLVKFGNAENCD
jgi:hypothetical protein